jgi:transcriptional regulator with XRE-family HTH domain
MAKQYDITALAAKAKESDAYWIEKAALDFTEDILAKMEEQGMSRTELAVRIDASPAYITKILRGSTNFTLQSMVKISRALGYELCTHLQPEGAQTRWFDMLQGKQDKKPDFKNGHELANFQKQFKVVENLQKEERDDTVAIAS